MFAKDPSLLLLGTETGITAPSRVSRRSSGSVNANFVFGEDDMCVESTKSFTPSAETAAAVVNPRPNRADDEGKAVMKPSGKDRGSKKFCLHANTNQQAMETPHSGFAAQKLLRKGRPVPHPPRKTLMTTKDRPAVRPHGSAPPNARPLRGPKVVKKPVAPSAPTPKKQQQQQQRSVSRGTITMATTTSSNAGGESLFALKSREVSFKAGDVAHGRRRRSFIESITLCEDDPWQPISRVTKTKRKKMAENAEAVLAPLPRQTVRQLYAEDMSPLPARGAASTSKPFSPRLSVTALKSPLGHTGEGDAYRDAQYSCSFSQSRTGGECGTLSKTIRVKGLPFRSLHAWNAPPSNVVLPNGTIPLEKKSPKKVEASCEYWHVTHPFVEDENRKGEWMRPLQEVGRSERNSIPGIDNTEKKKPHSSNDDDYHNLFHSLQKNHALHHHHHRMDAPHESTAQPELSGIGGFTNSFAACSALLKEPQQLLDSEFLVSHKSPSSPRLRKSTVQTSLPLLDNSWISLMQATEKNPQFVELSHPGKVLFASLLYLRALGGFPTLLHINPLSKSSLVVGKEHCVELVFCLPSGRQHDTNAASLPSQPTLSRSTRIINFILEGRHAHEKDGQDKHVGWVERRVIVRSILAEKSIVDRFGKVEVVHVLPPIKNETASMKPEADDSHRRQLIESKSKAVSRLLHDSTSEPHADAQSQLPYGLSFPGGFKYGRKTYHMDCGDLAVAFLISGKLSQISGVPPEPMDLEALRYKVYALRQHELEDTTRKEAFNTATTQRTGVGVEFPIQEGRTPFQAATVRTESTTPAGLFLKNALNVGSMHQRFPAYTPVTIAESTIVAMTDGTAGVCKGDQQAGECESTQFSQLRFPRFYIDLVDAVQHAIEVQDKLKHENAARARFFQMT
ncbi:hypothetical protein MOQ_001016 [Trypanosoma cruzi marinkellei]|uniref:Uncharacterized protein n=1 Tax=Trypanosoma cruzi marinkellei TaxID=85056 RepID=K2PCI1_TRYCR|nr:hypothetical protein MOQ_001016 [Trypanosoma cruzi marinkellei]